jgi:hypothetical protein
MVRLLAGDTDTAHLGCPFRSLSNDSESNKRQFREPKQALPVSEISFRSLPIVSWEISANLGRHVRTGVDAGGWLWEIARGDQVAQVVIEISGTAWSSDPRGLPEDTRQALETDGRTELLKVLDQDDPPRVIRCGSTGCSYLA